MSHLPITRVLLAGLLLLAAPALAQKTSTSESDKTSPSNRPQLKAKDRTKAKPARICKLRLSWWDTPENLPELAILQDKERIPVTPGNKSFSQSIEYQGEGNAVVLKRTVTEQIDKAGKPVIQWTPYCTITLKEENTDLGILLFPDEARGVAQTRIFDLGPVAFPYGTVQLVNLTSGQLAVTLDGTTFVANSRGAALCPKTFAKDGAYRFLLAVNETTGERKLLRSSMMIVGPKSRYLFFVFEIPGAPEHARYHTALVTDNLPEKLPTVTEGSPQKIEQDDKKKPVGASAVR
jgi:hypothetical protein